ALAPAIGDHRPAGAGADLAEPGLVALEHVVEDARPPGLGHELRPEPDEPPGGHQVLDADPAVAMVDELLHPALPGGEELAHGAEVVLGDEHRHALDRFAELSVDLPGDDLGLADRELEALPSHRLDQDGQLQLAPALDLPGVRPGRG